MTLLSDRKTIDDCMGLHHASASALALIDQSGGWAGPVLGAGRDIGGRPFCRHLRLECLRPFLTGSTKNRASPFRPKPSLSIPDLRASRSGFEVSFLVAGDDRQGRDRQNLAASITRAA